MGKGRRGGSELTWRVDAGRHTDYKEVGVMTWSEVKHPQGNHLFHREHNQMQDFHREHQSKTRIGDDSFFQNDHDDDEGNPAGNRIHWNEPQQGVLDHHRDYQNESMNIRSGEEDNNNCADTNTGLNRLSNMRHHYGRRSGLSNLWMPLTIFFVVTTFIFLTSNVGLVSSCNEAVCASIVSKCTLTQACKCELKNCTCCRECFDCLTYLYDECCSCVELCPRPNHTHHVIMHSQVGDLKEPIDELFKALTEEKDIQGRWATFTYPIDIDQSWFMPKPEAASSANVYTVANGKIIVDPTKEVVTVNCTVAYMSECMPLNKCKNSCHSMGASYFRWFHDGCCECIGSTCINYGIDESRCTRCTMEDDAEDDPLDSEAPDETDNDTGKET